jgi:hypothetical protein
VLTEGLLRVQEVPQASEHMAAQIAGLPNGHVAIDTQGDAHEPPTAAQVCLSILPSTPSHA